MADKTHIAWTQATWNPITGCSHVSEGCRNCYAERLSHRFGRTSKPWSAANAVENVVCHPERLEIPLHWRKPRRVFVDSMSDLFHCEVSQEFLLTVWAVMEAASWHTFQVLTKRPERMREFLAAFAPQASDDVVPQPAYERRPVPGWPGYLADTEGTIWSERRGIMHRLAPCVTSLRGHAHVVLHAGAGSEPRQEKIHRLVLITFDRPPVDGEETRHLDGDPTNNRISNLRWGSRAENSADRTRHGNAITSPHVQANQVASIRIAALRGETQRSIGEQFGISHTQVSRIVTGEQWAPRPHPWIWLGVSVEDQRAADERIPLLLQVPAAVRFVSVEPMLGPVLLNMFMPCNGYYDGPNGSFRWRYDNHPNRHLPLDGKGLHWVIAGGESGPGARPMHPDWVRGLRDQCQAAGVSFFFKQWGEYAPALLPGNVYVTGERYGPYFPCGRQIWINRAGEYTDAPFPDSCGMGKVGKKAAGDTLDGERWQQYPEVG